ncbi:hypothetical protein BS50DRAFT_567244 [Corynespora cassiicola Philippines]|uniref:F-box domain-containing protein n=1 Tax=Corynespora cassiicola Philippines TaxID=1448308 RepID=A0A2T2P9S2_CORCC|nr:hypothetical protein BS50DRAFT_567244 [Corynespora cassiicola Philippines]
MQQACPRQGEGRAGDEVIDKLSGLGCKSYPTIEHGQWPGLPLADPPILARPWCVVQTHQFPAPSTTAAAMASTSETKPPVSSPCFLFGLPNELLDHIVEKLSGDDLSLCALAQTCRHLQPICEKQIYSTVELYHTQGLTAIIKAFAARVERVQSVQKLKIVYKYHDALTSTMEERSEFNQYIPQMRSLKDWHIESPYDNFQWEFHGREWVENDMEHFRKALEDTSLHHQVPLKTNVGLAKLERLTIHSHGPATDFWDLDGFHCLFRHPTLRYLHASCFTLPADLPELEGYEKKTPLQTLIFDECEIEPKSLARILQTPQKLKHLTLGENVHNNRRHREVNARLTTAPRAAIEALSAVADSLETLTHYDPYWRALAYLPSRPRPELHGDGLRNFLQLKSINCDLHSFLHSSITRARSLAPPHLEVLRIRHPPYRQRDRNPGFFDHLPDYEPYTYLDSLRTLELLQTTTLESKFADADYICQPEILRERHSYAYKLHKIGINFKLLVEMKYKDTYIPPYLHGEHVPITRCLYDAAEFGFEHKPEPSPDALQPRDTTVQSDELSEEDILRAKNMVRRTLQDIVLEFELAGSDSDSDTDSDLHGPILAILQQGFDSDEFEDFEDGFELPDFLSDDDNDDDSYYSVDEETEALDTDFYDDDGDGEDDLD